MRITTTPTEVYGVQYKLVLSDFEKRRTVAGVGTREYADWSGQVRIEVPANKVRDRSTSTNYPNVVNRSDTDTYGNSYKANITYTGITNNQNLYYTMNGEFIDVVKPTFTYQYSNTVIVHARTTG